MVGRATQNTHAIATMTKLSGALRRPKTRRAMIAKVMTCSVVLARILPNRMLVIKPDCAEPKLLNKMPRPDANARTVPVTTPRWRAPLLMNGVVKSSRPRVLDDESTRTARIIYSALVKTQPSASAPSTAVATDADRIPRPHRVPVLPDQPPTAADGDIP